MSDISLWERERPWRHRVDELRLHLLVATQDGYPPDLSWVTSVEALLARIEAIESRMEEIEGIG